MDESWRIPIGSVVPRRRSTEQPRRPPGGGFGLDPDDFRDVFGGPPRTVLLRQFSGGDLTSPSSSYSTASYFDRLQRHHQPGPSRCQPSFYEEVFRRQPPETSGSREGKAGRSLPYFRIPSAAEEGSGGDPRRRDEEGGFYDDIFGWEPERRSRTRSRQSKSNSSSVLSSEEQDGGEMVGAIRPWVADDGVLSTFASKLRPIITIPSRRCDAPSPTLPDEQFGSHRTSAVPCPSPGLMELRFKDCVAVQKAVDPCKLFRPYSPPEIIIGVEPKRPAATDDESDSDSPSSVISSIYDIPMATIRPVWTHGKKVVVAPQVSEKEEVVVVPEEEDEANSPYEIEIVPGQKAAETEGSTAVDEAIAWAKERSRSSPLEGIGVGRGSEAQEVVTGGYARPRQEQRGHALSVAATYMLS